ncbi:MAG: hypothetical protein AAB396_00785, partial [Patescibacteria group bacterium]
MKKITISIIISLMMLGSLGFVTAYAESVKSSGQAPSQAPSIDNTTTGVRRDARQQIKEVRQNVREEIKDARQNVREEIKD